MRGIEGAGVEVQQGTATVVGLDFAEPLPGVPDLAGRMAAPAVLVNRGHLDLSDSTITGAVGFAISIQNDGTAQLSGIELSHTASFDGEVTGVDLVVNSDAIVTAQGLTLLGPTSTGVGVQGATLIASDMVLEPSTGFGIGAYEDGIIDLTGASITGRGGAALVAFGDGAEVTADEVDIRETHRTESIKLAIAATGYGGTLHLSNARITDTEGVALSAENGHLDCTHCTVEGAKLAGVLIENGTASLTDVRVRDVDPETTTGLALGVIVAATGEGAATLEADELDVLAGFGALFVVNASATVNDSVLESEGPIELLALRREQHLPAPRGMPRPPLYKRVY